MMRASVLPVIMTQVRETVSPLSVYVARRDSFELAAPLWMKIADVIGAAFDIAPLAEHGWKRSDVRARALGNGIWRIERY